MGITHRMVIETEYEQQQEDQYQAYRAEMERMYQEEMERAMREEMARQEMRERRLRVSVLMPNTKFTQLAEQGYMHGVSVIGSTEISKIFSISSNLIPHAYNLGIANGT